MNNDQAEDYCGTAHIDDVVKQPRLAIWVTTVYCAGALFCLWRFLPDWPQSFDTWGAFLSGVFSPVAFLWLVVGYFQQQKEFRLNTKALRAQVDETRALVSAAHMQARATVEAARVAGEQLKRVEAAERAALIPRYSIQRNPPYRVGDTFARYSIQNVGRLGQKTCVFAEEPFNGSIDIVEGFFPESKVAVLTLAGPQLWEASFYFQIRATATDGSRSAQGFRFDHFEVSPLPGGVPELIAEAQGWDENDFFEHAPDSATRE